MRRLVSWLCMAVLFGGVGSDRALAQSQFTESPCPFLIWAPEVEGETVICGTVDVPESRSGLSDGVVTLQVAILKARTDAPVAPVIYLDGGPGASALAAVYFWMDNSMRNHADFILYDQRGTGHSRPSLNCIEYDADDLPADADVEALCRDRLIAEGVTLAAYTSSETAADVDALIAALGLPEATLYGVSYGTRAALTTLRDYPDRIRSVIIDSVYPPHVNGYNEQVVNGARAFEVLFRDCEASRVCNLAYPDLRDTFLNMIRDLNRRPMVGVDEFGIEVRLNGDDVTNELFKLLYSTTVLPYLPAIITAAAAGDYDAYVTLIKNRDTDISVQLEQLSNDEFDAYVARYLSFESVEAYIAYRDGLATTEYLDLLDEIYSREEEKSPAEQEALDARLMEMTGIADLDDLYTYLRSLNDDEYYDLIDEAYGTVDDDSEGLFNSVECYEEIPFNSTRTAERLADAVPRVLATALFPDVERQFVSCGIWGVPAGPASENEPVVSDKPVLVLSGEYDPITPPAWGQAAADYLPNSTHFVLPGMGHGLVDVIGKPCPTAIAVQFLLNPMGELDGSCVEKMTPPAFYVD